MGFDDKYRKGALRIIDIAESAVKIKNGNYLVFIPYGRVECKCRAGISGAIHKAATDADKAIEKMLGSV